MTVGGARLWGGEILGCFLGFSIKKKHLSLPFKNMTVGGEIVGDEILGCFLGFSIKKKQEKKGKKKEALSICHSRI